MSDDKNDSDKSFESCQNSAVKDDESEKSFQSCLVKNVEQDLVGAVKSCDINDEDDDDIKPGSCRENASEDEVSDWGDEQWLYDSEYITESNNVDRKLVKSVSEEQLKSCEKDMKLIMEKYVVKKNEDNGRASSQNNVCLNNKEQRSDPSVVPTDSRFYMHDVRVTEEEEKEKEAGKVVASSTITKKQRAHNDKIPDRWGHDLYVEKQQKPITKNEIIYKYGYDIRNGEEFNNNKPNRSAYSTFPNRNNRKSWRGNNTNRRQNDYYEYDYDYYCSDYYDYYGSNNYGYYDYHRYDQVYYNRKYGGKEFRNNNKLQISAVPVKKPNEIKKNLKNSKPEYKEIQITFSRSDSGNRTIKNVGNPSKNTTGPEDASNIKRNNSNSTKSNFESRKKAPLPDWDVSSDFKDVIEEMPPLTEKELNQIAQKRPLQQSSSTVIQQQNTPPPRFIREKNNSQQQNESSKSMQKPPLNLPKRYSELRNSDSTFTGDPGTRSLDQSPKSTAVDVMNYQQLIPNVDYYPIIISTPTQQVQPTHHQNQYQNISPQMLPMAPILHSSFAADNQPFYFQPLYLPSNTRVNQFSSPYPSPYLAASSQTPVSSTVKLSNASPAPNPRPVLGRS